MAAIIDQTRPDLLKCLKSFLIKCGIRWIYRKCGIRWIYYKVVLFPVQSTIYHIIRPSKKKCCILRPNVSISTTGGVCLYLNRVLGACVYAELRNMIPVVDMLTLPNPFLQDDEVGYINSWKYYFEQPGRIELDEALSQRDFEVVMLPCSQVIVPAQDSKFFKNFLGQLTFWRKMFRKYIRFAPAVLERFEYMKAKYEGMRILGVKVRGTDYVTTKPSGHPIPPTPEQVISKAREAMKENSFDAVYLATEDKKIVSAFQKAFRENLILPEVAYVDYNYDNTVPVENWLYRYHIDRDNDKYLSGMEYLVSILFLSRCDGFITSGNNGSVVAMLLSDGFDYFYFFDLGMYP